MKPRVHTWKSTDSFLDDPGLTITAIDGTSDGQLLYEVAGCYTAAELGQIGRLLANDEKQQGGDTLSAQDWAQMQAAAGAFIEGP